MTLTRRRKVVLAALLLYWPAIFILTHIPNTYLSQWVIATQIGDKTPHFLAYLGLVFLWWFMISPYRKVDWFRPAVWVTIAIMAVYGTLDEWLQGFVGRQPDIWDFAADMAGVISALLLLTFVEFWGAALIVGGSIVFAATNIMRIDIVGLMPRTSPIFYLISYALIAACWTNHLSLRYWLNPPDRRWLPLALLMPLAFMTFTHAYSAWALDRTHTSPLVAGSAGIVVVIATRWLYGLLRPKPQAS